MKDQFQLDERAAEAKNILNSPLFQEAIRKMREHHIARLMQAVVGSDEAKEAHAMLKVVSEFEVNFQSIMTDQKMDQYYRKAQHGTG
jgi:hypothetical protein